MTTRTTFRIETQTGVTLDGVAQGDRSGPAVLLLHGYSDSWRSYEPLLDALPPRLYAIAASQRGHGDSDRPATGYTMADFAGDLPAVLDHVDIERAAVVGHSMGSMVAARLALAQPARVEALVLIGALTTLQGNAAIDDEFCDAILALTDPVDAGFVREFQESTLARPVPSDFMEGIVAESCKLPARIWREALDAMLADDLTPDLPRIAVPTLLLWGDRDGICDHAGQTRMASALPSAEFSIRAGAGHAPHWEDPQGIAKAIAAFVDGVRVA